MDLETGRPGVDWEGFADLPPASAGAYASAQMPAKACTVGEV